MHADLALLEALLGRPSKGEAGHMGEKRGLVYACPINFCANPDAFY